MGNSLYNSAGIALNPNKDFGKPMIVRGHLPPLGIHKQIDTGLYFSKLGTQAWAV